MVGCGVWILWVGKAFWDRTQLLSGCGGSFFFFVFGPAKTIRRCSHFVDLMVVYCFHFVVV